MVIYFIAALLLNVCIEASDQSSCKISDPSCTQEFDFSPYIYHLRHWMKSAKKESENELFNESMGGAAAGSVALTVRQAGSLGVDGGKHLAVEGIAEGLAHTAGAGALAGVVSATAPIFVGFLVAGATAYTLSKAFKLAKYTTKTLPHCKKICLGESGDRLARVGAKYLEHTVSFINKEKNLEEVKEVLKSWPREEQATKNQKPKIEYLVARLSNSPDDQIDRAMQEAVNCIMGCPTGISRYFICKMIFHISSDSPVDVLMQFAQILSASSSPDFKMFRSNSILSKFLYVKKEREHACLRQDGEYIRVKMNLLNKFYEQMMPPKKTAQH